MARLVLLHEELEGSFLKTVTKLKIENRKSQFCCRCEIFHMGLKEFSLSFMCYF